MVAGSAEGHRCRRVRAVLHHWAEPSFAVAVYVYVLGAAAAAAVFSTNKWGVQGGCHPLGGASAVKGTGRWCWRAAVWGCALQMYARVRCGARLTQLGCFEAALASVGVGGGVAAHVVDKCLAPVWLECTYKAAHYRAQRGSLQKRSSCDQPQGLCCRPAAGALPTAHSLTHVAWGGGRFCWYVPRREALLFALLRSTLTSQWASSVCGCGWMYYRYRAVHCGGCAVREVHAEVAGITRLQQQYCTTHPGHYMTCRCTLHHGSNAAGLSLAEFGALPPVVAPCNTNRGLGRSRSTACCPSAAPCCSRFTMDSRPGPCDHATALYEVTG